MYNDNRVLLPNGQLSQDPNKPLQRPGPVLNAQGMLAQPLHQPVQQAPIQMQSMPMDVKKPEGSKVYYDIEKARQEAQQAAAQDQGGGGMTIICTRFHELGFISDDHYLCAAICAKLLRAHFPHLLVWYLSWATWFTKRMHNNSLLSKIFIKLLWLFWFKHWTAEMIYRIGKIGNGSLYGSLSNKFVLYLYSLSDKGKKHPYKQTPYEFVEEMRTMDTLKHA